MTALNSNLTLHIRAQPLTYTLGYSLGVGHPIWLQNISASIMTRSPGYPNFEGVMFALFASGNGEPWPYDAPEVGFSSVREEYFEERIPDYAS